MKRRILASIAGLGLVAAAAATPAAAYDTVAYGTYAAGFVATSDIPKALGSFRPNPDVSIQPAVGRWFVCEKVKAAEPSFIASASYNPRKPGTAAGVNTTAYVYPSNVKAEKAFRSITKRLSACAGTRTSSDTDSVGNTFTWTSTVATGTVDSVTITGVASVFVDSDTTSTSTQSAAPEADDWYTVYTLVNDTILATQVTGPPNGVLSAKQKKAANQLAFNAEGAWVTD